MTSKQNSNDDFNKFLLDVRNLSTEEIRKKYRIIESIDTNHWVYGCSEIAKNENRIDEAYRIQVEDLLKKMLVNNTVK